MTILAVSIQSLRTTVQAGSPGGPSWQPAEPEGLGSVELLLWRGSEESTADIASGPLSRPRLLCLCQDSCHCGPRGVRGRGNRLIL